MALQKLAVVGAGIMGKGIAQVGLQSGMDVVIYDSYAPALDGAKAYYEKQFAKSVEKGRITAEDKENYMSHLTVSYEISGIEDADIIIEAVKEDVNVKKEVLEAVSAIVREDAIIGSNTSSISITILGAAVKNPERFLGTHFFNPVPAMKLLELIRGLCTSEETVAAAKEWGASLKKICVLSKDSAGFIANRIASPMLNAAANVLDSGVASKEDIDAAMKYGYGFPMGPLELMDLVGLDTMVSLLDVFYEEFGDPYYMPAPLMKRMVAAGMLGRKTGRGFYDYTK